MSAASNAMTITRLSAEECILTSGPRNTLIATAIKTDEGPDRWEATMNANLYAELMNFETSHGDTAEKAFAEVLVTNCELAWETSNSLIDLRAAYEVMRRPLKPAQKPAEEPMPVECEMHDIMATIPPAESARLAAVGA